MEEILLELIEDFLELLKESFDKKRSESPSGGSFEDIVLDFLKEIKEFWEKSMEAMQREISFEFSWRISELEFVEEFLKKKIQERCCKYILW